MNQINSMLESYINLLKNYGGKIELLNLQPGQIIQGKVLELLNEKNALVQINNSKMMAKLEVPLVKGQSSWFVVTSADEEIRLKILTVDKQSSQLLTGTQDVLNYLNIKNNSTNRLILNELIKRDLPMDKGIIEAVALLLKDKITIEEAMQAVKFLKAKKIEVNYTNIRVVNELFQNQSLLDKLSEVYKSIEKFTSNINKNNIASGEQSKQFSSISKIDNSYSNLLNTPIKQVEKQSSELINNNHKLQINSEITNQLTKLVGEIEKLINDFKIYQNETVINTNLNDFEKIDSKQILSNVTKYMDLLQQQLFNKAYESNIIKGLEQLLTHKNVLPKDLVMHLEKAVSHVVGQYYAMSPEHGIFNQTIIQFPAFIPNLKSPVFLQVHTKKKEGKKSIDPNDMMLVFLFSLDNLGDTMVQMKIVQRQLIIQINNDDPNIKEIIDQVEPEFIEFIKKNGYQTSGLTVKPFNKKIENRDSSSLQTSYKGVDIKI